jgi:hypothetical protein
MKVNISYHDVDALTMEEIVSRAVTNYGRAAKIEIQPESNLAYDQIYMGIWQLLTHRQISLYHDKSGTYQADLKGLRADILYKIQEILDQVIIDNESKVA